MRSSTIFLLSSIVSLACSQQVADGTIVPFTSVLPACASVCGKLFDVQGACSPPAIAAVSTTCFCGDARLTPILDTGTAGVTEVCGTSSAQSCTATSDLEKIQSWYATFCNLKDPNASATSSGSSATGSSASSSTKTPVAQTWFQGHWKYMVMLIIMIIAIAGGWVGAVFIRRRYIRKKEREIEMKPPVAWGPHQMQGATGGYNYETGAANKEIGAAAGTPAATTSKGGWLKKTRT